MQEKVDKIVKAIKIAFEDVVYPGDDVITYADVNYDPGAKDIMESFRGIAWQSVSFELVLAHSDALFFMTPEAHQYYLPAFLTTCILSRRKKTDILISIIFDLIPLKQVTRIDKDFFLKKFGVFTVAQVDIIVLFLEFALNELNDDRVYRKYVKSALNFWRAHSSAK